MGATSPALRLQGVTKSFPGVKALRSADLEVLAGEVHAVVGENGAGKSTLMSITAGSLLADEGTVEIGGRVMRHPSPAAAQELGLAVVYQRPALLAELSIAENLALAMPPARRPELSRARAWARERLDVVGAVLDPRDRAGDLTVAQRQLVEIAKAFALEPRVLILDEPTEALSAQDVERLFKQVKLFTDSGTAVVYISHRLPEVRRFADRITVLRDGEIRGTYGIDEVTEEDVLRLIVGRPVATAFPPKAGTRAASVDAPVLDLGAATGARFSDVALQVRAGEIVGLAGVEGNGQREVARAIAGLEPFDGEVRLGGARADSSSPRNALEGGVVYIPGDRHGEALFPSLSVRENLTVLTLPEHARAGVMQPGRESVTAGDMLAGLAVKTPAQETAVSLLSGGNQQKVVLARALSVRPRLLVAEQPTQGVDVQTRMEIYRLLRAVADEGGGVLVVSSDALELQGLCDRVLAFSRGRICAELAGDQVTETAITSAIIRGSLAQSDADAAVPAPPHRRPRPSLWRLLRGDHTPGLVLMVTTVLLMLFAGGRNELFLTDRNFEGLLFMASALIFVSLGQMVAMLLGGIDLSVGPLMGLLVVIASFAVGGGAGPTLLMIALMVSVATLAGLLNGGLIRYGKMSPVVATLVTFIALQGVSLLLRPRPGGLIDERVTMALTASVGFVPWVFLVAVAVTVAAEWALRRTRWGLGLRAVGSDEPTAHRLAVNAMRTQILGYCLCSLFTALGAFVLMAQIGIGDATSGTTYTVSSITAVVLAGASIFGGRGSFLGAACAALLLETTVNVSTFLDLDDAWRNWLLGLLTLGAAAAFSRLRSGRARHHGRSGRTGLVGATGPGGTTGGGPK